MRVDGIVCDHCKKVVAAELMKDAAIQSVKIKNGVAELRCTQEPDFEACARRIVSAGYGADARGVSVRRRDVQSAATPVELIVLLLILLLIAFGLERLFGYNIFNVIPRIDSSLTYGALIVTGLLTSVHCVSMCGAINLAAVYEAGGGTARRPLLYNLGRVLSYAATGALAGAIGGSLRVSDTAQGIGVTVAAALMLLMSLQMLGVVDFPRPACLSGLRRGQGALAIGLLNGLMPCGPLQAMQLYAAGTGSALRGALSMLLFGFGTVPLMLSMGLLLKIKRGKWKKWLTKASSALFLLLAVSMLGRGLSALGVDLKRPSAESADYITATMADGYQLIEGELDYNSYGNYRVLAGVPVRFVLHTQEDRLTGCNETLLLPDFGIEWKLEPGDNVIEFTPEAAGTYTFTCWMRMIQNEILVSDDIKLSK